jgi:hypothetical protein
MTLVRSSISCSPESALESSPVIRCGKSLLPTRAAVLAADETREQSAPCSFTVFRCRRAQLGCELHASRETSMPCTVATRWSNGALFNKQAFLTQH